MKILIKNIGFVLFLIMICVQILAVNISNNMIFNIYHDFIYQKIRYIYDFTIGQSPIAAIYFLTPFFVYLSYKLFKFCQTTYNTSGLKLTINFFTNFIGIGYFLFYFLWAFNYYRPPLEKQLSFASITVDSIYLQTEINEITLLMEQERKLISKDTAALKITMDWTVLEDTLRSLQVDLLRTWGDTPTGRVRIRALEPKGVLLSISTAGIYIPFVCEGHVDAGLHTLQWPFTLAHEMSHGYGYTDEGVCNFIALITCMKSSNPYIRYSAFLGYWRYLYFELKQHDEALASNLYRDVFQGIKADLASIKMEHGKYPDFMPNLRNLIYDFYLKFNGVQTGINSYSEIIIQVQKWKRSKFSFSFYR